MEVWHKLVTAFWQGYFGILLLVFVAFSPVGVLIALALHHALT